MQMKEKFHLRKSVQNAITKLYKRKRSAFYVLQNSPSERRSCTDPFLNRYGNLSNDVYVIILAARIHSANCAYRRCLFKRDASSRRNKDSNFIEISFYTILICERIRKTNICTSLAVLLLFFFSFLKMLTVYMAIQCWLECSCILSLLHPIFLHVSYLPTCVFILTNLLIRVNSFGRYFFFFRLFLLYSCRYYFFILLQ